MSAEHPAAQDQYVEALVKVGMDRAEAERRVADQRGRGLLSEPPLSESAAEGRRVWRIPIYVGFGGVVVTIEPWTWRGLRRRLSRV